MRRRIAVESWGLHGAVLQQDSPEQCFACKRIIFKDNIVWYARNFNFFISLCTKRECLVDCRYRVRDLFSDVKVGAKHSETQYHEPVKKPRPRDLLPPMNHKIVPIQEDHVAALLNKAPENHKQSSSSRISGSKAKHAPLRLPSMGKNDVVQDGNVRGSREALLKQVANPILEPFPSMCRFLWMRCGLCIDIYQSVLLHICEIGFLRRKVNEANYDLAKQLLRVQRYIDVCWNPVF